MSKYLQKIKNNKLGIATLFFSLSFMCVGLPSQIIEIWKTHSVKGVSGVTFLLLTTQSIFWVLYGKQRKDKVIIAVNIFGALFAAVIVIEYIIFH
jgi:uncharacterized protein with PQ loop repeat